MIDWAERLSTIPRLDYPFAAVDSLGLIDQPDVLRQVIRAQATVEYEE